MKKITVVSLASFGFLMLCSIVAIMMREVLVDPVLALVAGIVILVFSGVIALFGRERVWLNIFCFAVNSVAMGFLIRAWYINRGFDNSLWLMCRISLLAVLYLWVFFALSRLPFVRGLKGANIALGVIYAALSAAVYFAVMINTETTYVSTFGYYMILELAFIFAMSLEVGDGRELLRNLTLSTYSVFVVAIIAAVFIAIAVMGGDSCDCDCGDCDCSGCDLGDCNVGGSSKKKKDGDIEP